MIVLNYQWFADRYPHFLYIDRVVVDGQWQDKNLATMLYSDLFSVAESE